MAGFHDLNLALLRWALILGQNNRWARWMGMQWGEVHRLGGRKITFRALLQYL